MFDLLASLLFFILALAFIDGMMLSLTGEKGLGGNIIWSCAAVVILYMVVLALFNSSENNMPILRSGIPLIKSIEQYGGLKNCLLNHSLIFAENFVELVTVTVIINWISKTLTFENSSFAAKILSKIMVVLLGVIAYGFIMDQLRSNIVIKWCVLAVESIITGGGILYTPIMIIAALTGISSDNGVLAYFLEEFKKTSFMKAVTTAISSTIVFLGYVMILENQYGSIGNIISGANKWMENFGSIFVMLIGIGILSRVLKKTLSS